jgi:hypothetical protein
VQAGARKIGLDDGHAVLGRRDRLLEPFRELAHPLGGEVVLSLTRPRDVGDAPLEALGGLARHLRDPVGDLLLRLAGELLDPFLQLPREPLGRLLTGLADLCVELLLRVFHETRGGAIEGAVERRQMPSLHVPEPGGETATRLAFLTLDLLAESSLAVADPLADLVQRPPALCRVQLDR